MPSCLRCKKSVPDDDEHRVALIKEGGRSVVFACAKHKPAISLSVSVTRAVVKAGVETALEAKAPGLLGRMTRAFAAIRGEG